MINKVFSVLGEVAITFAMMHIALAVVYTLCYFSDTINDLHPMYYVLIGAAVFTGLRRFVKGTFKMTFLG